MQRYIILRLWTGLVTLFIVSLIVFALLRIVPGDPAIAGIVARYGEQWERFFTVEELERERERMGIDGPLHLQFVEWWWGVVRLDLGHTFFTKEPILSVLKRTLPFSFQVAVVAMAVSIVMGIGLGLVAALRQYTMWDYVARIFSIVGLSIPNFFLATLLIYGALRLFGGIPPLGTVYIWDDPFKAIQQLWMPAIVLGTSGAAVAARMTRSQMLEVLREDYIRTARAKGLSDRVVTYRHALRNALLPVVTIIGAQVAGLLSGTVIIESIFNIPGLGLALLSSLRERDYLLAQDAILVSAIFIIAAHLIVDLSYAVLDPRIRYR